MNWRLASAERVVQSNYRSPRQFDDWRKLGTAEQAKQLEGLFAGMSEPIAILPTANKFVQTLGLPYAHLFRALHARLSQPQTFFLVVGYGFGDAHLNRVIDDALNNPGLVLLVVDPRPSQEVRSRVGLYQQTGERAFLLHPSSMEGDVDQCGFDDFAEHVLPQVQWLEEFIRIRKVGKSLQPDSVDNSPEALF